MTIEDFITNDSKNVFNEIAFKIKSSFKTNLKSRNRK